VLIWYKTLIGQTTIVSILNKKKRLIKKMQSLTERKEKFLQNSLKVHGNTYDYSLVNFVDNLTKVDIICSIHGVFQQSPKKHVIGQGCRTCGRLQASLNTRKGLDSFLKEVTKLHNNFYNYDKVQFELLTDTILITCPTHGDFYQKAVHHKKGAGCQKCYDDRRHLNTLSSTSEFISKAKLVHKDKYEYDEVEYINAKTYIKVKCKKHGLFLQTPDCHLSGYGCKSCSHIVSNAQIELENFVKSLGVVTKADIPLSDKTEIDIFCPDYNIGFEYNGLRFHNEFFKNKSYHLTKTNVALSQGIDIVHIWEDEWLLNRNKIENLIRVKLGKLEQKYDARKCEVRCVEWSEAYEFLNRVHLQSSCAPTNMSYGLYYKGSLVSLMCFTKTTTAKDSGIVELIRFCSIGNVRGGFGRLIKYFLKNNSSFNSIVSFSDRRLGLGKIYEKMGFKCEGYTEPAYWWTRKINRHHRRGFQHQYLKDKLEIYNPDLSEVQNCHANGYARVWDCGHAKWTMKLNS
jgi:hypothetical protein